MCHRSTHSRDGRHLAEPRSLPHWLFHLEPFDLSAQFSDLFRRHPHSPTQPDLPLSSCLQFGPTPANQVDSFWHHNIRCGEPCSVLACSGFPVASLERIIFVV